MRKFEEPVRERMSKPVHTVGAGDRLIAAERRIAELGISALAVLDGDRPVGVISRTDLLRAGRIRVTNGEKDHALQLPDAKVSEHMHTPLEAVTSATSLRAAAKQMVETHYHRLFVAEDGVLVGVVGTREMMRAVLTEHVRVPIADIMTSSVVTISIDDPLAVAIDRLAAAHRWGLVVVVDGEWPVGAFSQVEALAARDAPPMQRVEHWMNPAVLCLPAEMPSDRAARSAIALGAPRIVAVGESGIRGLVSGMDFARLVADAP